MTWHNVWTNWKVWKHECMSGGMGMECNECMNETNAWRNGWTNELNWIEHGNKSEKNAHGMNEWTNEWMMYAPTNEQMKGRMKRTIEYTHVCTQKWRNERMNRMNEPNEWMNEWMNWGGNAWTYAWTNGGMKDGTAWDEQTKRFCGPKRAADYTRILRRRSDH